MGRPRAGRGQAARARGAGMVKLDKKPTKAHAQANRWCGLMMLQNVIQTVMMTNNFEENLDTGLKVNAITRSMAAAMHVPAMMNKTQPKELCLQQLVVMPLIAAASFMATRD